jgi:predicted nucleotidyltransferase
MLNIINNLEPFFEDCYRRINVREYSRIMNVSPPTASKNLFEMNREDLLKIEKDRNYIFFYANKENKNFIDLSRIYWRNKLKGLIDYLNKNLVNPSLVLFGSLAKAEVKEDSDMDIAIFSNKKELDLKSIERKLKRKVQLFWLDSFKKNKELKNNILNGYILQGKLMF